MIKKLAKITSAKLQIQERGILTFWIHIVHEDGGCQAIGGFALDDYDEKTESRVGTVYGCEMIRRLLLELDVDDFSEMKDQIIWVYGEGEDFNFRISGLSKLKVNGGNDKPLIFVDILNEFI